jgi:flagellar biosynthesis chaperone FliJ
MADEIKSQEKLIESTNVQIHKRQEKVAEAYREFKTMERLKEVQQKIHYGAWEAHQVKEIDDLVTSRYATRVV